MGQGPPASRRAHACARTGARPEAPAQGPKFWVPPLRVLLVSTHSQKGTPKCWGWDHEGEVGFGVKELVLVVDLGGSGLGWFSGGRNGGSGHISGRKVGGGGGTKDASRRLGSILGHRDPHTGGSPPDRVPLSPSSTHHETLTPPPPRGSGPPNPLPLFPNPPPQPKRNPGIRVLPPNSPGTPQKEQGNTPPPPAPGIPKNHVG